MKIPYSYKKHAFGTLLGVSLAGHVLMFSFGGLVVSEPQYAVEQSSSSIEVVMIEQTKVVIEEKKIEVEEVKPILTTKDMTEETVKKVEEVIQEVVEKPIVEEDIKEDIEEKKAVVIDPEKGARTEAKPDYLKNNPPMYPNLARQRGWEGTVYLRVVVEKNGTPSAVEIAKSSGHRILDRAAVRSVKKWKFLPARVGNMILTSSVEIPVRFVLED